MIDVSHLVKMQDKKNVTFTLNENGAIELNNEEYDVSAINDYILHLQTQARDSFKEGYERGAAEGEARAYHEMRRRSHLVEGNSYFSNGGDINICVGVDEKVHAATVKNEVYEVLQEVEYADFVELNKEAK